MGLRRIACLSQAQRLICEIRVIFDNTLRCDRELSGSSTVRLAPSRYYPAVKHARRIATLCGMKEEQFKFIAHESKGEVSAHLMVPRGAKAVVVLGHGAGAGMYHANMQNIAEQLAERKIGTFRYQFPFMERGGGRDSEKVSLATVCNAIRETKKRVRKKPIFAGGHSFGGRMTSLAAAADDFPDVVSGLIFFAFPLHAPNKPSDHRVAHLPDITLPMLFLTGTRDALNSLDLFEPVIKKLKRKKKPVTLHLLDTANHGYRILKKSRESEEDIFEEMGRVASEWIELQS